MCCVIFSWLTTEDYFKDLTEADVKALVTETMVEDYTHLLGFVSNGISTHEPVDYYVAVPV